MTAIKVSDYIANFLEEAGVTHCFGVTGGAALHLINSIETNSSITFIACHDERSAAMAADGYSRGSKKIGVALSTSGPGATNLITGIAGAFFDSIPVIFITGQVSSYRLKGPSKIRQRGFQETPIVQMVEPIVKYCYQIKNKDEIPKIFDLAKSIALDGRPGPVLIDIPDDIQREYIHTVKKIKPNMNEEKPDLHLITSVKSMVTELKKSKRPLILAGFGIHLSNSEKLFNQFCKKLDIPIIATWGAAALIEENNQKYLGTFGTHGMRHNNYIIENSDLIISVGARLDLKATGTPPKTFAPYAKKFIVDIDNAEIDKLINYEVTDINPIVADVTSFLKLALVELETSEITKVEKWVHYTKEVEKFCSTQDKLHREVTSNNKINPYEFFEILYKNVFSLTAIILDTGCTVAWAMQTLIRNNHIRTFHDFNNTAMGWSLPATVGLSSAGYKNCILVVGDGSIMFTLSELSTINKYTKNSKIFVLNNKGYAMIKQSQRQWLDGKYHGSGVENGLNFPDFKFVALSVGIKYYLIESSEELIKNLQEIMAAEENVFCEIVLDPNIGVIPITRAGSMNSSMDPELDEEPNGMKNE